MGIVQSRILPDQVKPIIPYIICLILPNEILRKSAFIADLSKNMKGNR